MVRAFIAVDLEPQIIRRIAEVLVKLRARIPGVRWVTPENFHLTLKFLGEIEESKIEPIAIALERELSLFSRFTINAKGLGVFPDAKRPRVLWVGLQDGRFARLAAKVEAAVAALGFESENRAFQPHLTVGRWRRFDGSRKAVADEIAQWQDYEFGTSEVREVILFRSVLRPEGAVYTSLKAVALAQASLPG